ncbi:uncharacterized protein LOC122672496 [Telopea speciosissima]|uniref:uncharacterized protein LOC122672496 n=1 Tax=Telopea speciosissima TaxID=54955 RepID=UPI001CC3A1F6|nr:uncharacterized protein LOC122672496 [Telopea speciosissima]
MEDFGDFVNGAGLIDGGFEGSTFTWTNGQSGRCMVKARLDRVLYNSVWSSYFQISRVHQLSRTCSDHAPLRLEVEVSSIKRPSSFKFQQMWLSHPGFNHFVKDCWSTVYEGSPLQILFLKLKFLRDKLKVWNKEIFGNIHQNVKNCADDVSQAEVAHDLNRCNDSLLQLYDARDRLQKVLLQEEIFWKEKSQVKWLLEEAVNCFANLFSSGSCSRHAELLDVIPSVITEEDNTRLIASPSLKEVEEAVFSLSKDSAPGLDGFTGHFFTSSWEIVKADVWAAMEDFFKGGILHRSFTSSHLILIPKMENLDVTSDCRPISLYVVQDLKRKTRGGNVLLKLDMAKAYDRMEWSFLVEVLAKFGFSKDWITLIQKTMVNYWFSVVMDASPFGFFKSSRGLHQGDPLSPTLFILAEEVLRGLRSLFAEGHAKFYQLSRDCPGISHSLFADDIIIFTKGLKSSLKQQVRGIFRAAEFGNRHHWENWTKACRPIKEGGLALRTLGDLSLSMRIKGIWRTLSENSLWSSFFKANFLKGNHITFANSNTMDSISWRKALEHKDFMLSNSRWLVEQGEVLFWLDNWLGVRPLLDFVDGAINVPLNAPVRDVLSKDGLWDQESLNLIDNLDIRDQIRNSNTFFSSRLDKIVWTPASDGIFSVKSTWNVVRIQHPTISYFKWLWNASVPTKIGFFSWQILNGNVPSDNTLMSLGVPLASKCVCCKEPWRETTNYIFIHGGMATKVWNFFNGLFDIVLIPTQDIRSRLLFWHAQATSSGICNFIKETPCAYILVSPFNMLKLNVDGASRGNPGVSGGGGIIRDCEGSLIAAFSNFCGICSNSVAEMRALLDGLQLYASLGLHGFFVSPDTASIVRFVTQRKCNLWSCWFWFQEVLTLCDSLGVCIHFAYRDSNHAADFLTNFACDSLVDSSFHDTQSIPQDLRRIVREDKTGLPVFRM